jgi:NitT/TauT family transport system permease protein
MTSLRIVRATLFFGLVFLSWELLARYGYISSMLFPSPSEILNYLILAISDGTLGRASIVTFERLALGYTLGVLLGLPLGLVCARFSILRDTIGLAALGFQTLPSVCWVPLALLCLGQSESAMLFVVVMGCLWSVMLATESGVRSVPPIYTKAAKTMGSDGVHALLFVSLPAALPQMLSGMKQGWAFAWRSLMAAEIYVTVLSGFGLGHLLHYGRELHAMDQVLGVIVVIMLSGYLVDRLIFGPLEGVLHRRWGIAN